MRRFFDTSTTVAAIVEDHPAHAWAFPWLEEVRSGSVTGVIAAHSIAELYSTLTRLPGQPRLTAAEARRLIESNVLDLFEVVALTDREYVVAIEHLSDLGIVGGAVYDGLLLRAAAKASVDQIVTLNERHFRRVYPALSDKLVAP